MDALDRFFSKLPREWHYGVEIRNANFLQEEYFTMLAAHQVAHVYNSWDAMPGIDEQIEKAGDALGTTPIGARLLLKPGRRYQTAVDQFQPYKHLQEIVPSARDASAQLIKKALQQKVPLSTVTIGWKAVLPIPYRPFSISCLNGSGKTRPYRHRNR